jgi:hypothetical protein
VIGQPVVGDHATAWRDNARVQYRNSIFMDLGERLVAFDNVDGDGGAGYGNNGTLSWANTWTTDYNVFSTVNAPANPAAFYPVQTSGKLAEISDSVFFRNLNGSAYTEATSRGVFNAGNNNVLTPGFADVDSPVTTLTRGSAVVLGSLTMLPVTFLDPRPANAALTSVGSAPNDGFFTPASYRGAFAPGENWLDGWTASSAFGFTDERDRHAERERDLGLHDPGRQRRGRQAGPDLLLDHRPVRRAVGHGHELPVREVPDAAHPRAELGRHGQLLQRPALGRLERIHGSRARCARPAAFRRSGLPGPGLVPRPAGLEVDEPLQRAPVHARSVIRNAE